MGLKISEMQEIIIAAKVEFPLRLFHFPKICSGVLCSVQKSKMHFISVS